MGKRAALRRPWSRLRGFVLFDLRRLDPRLAEKIRAGDSEVSPVSRP
jgi:hypothetical protein